MSESYSFTDWDKERFAHAGAVLASLAINREAPTDARQKILELYFTDMGVAPNDGTSTTV